MMLDHININVCSVFLCEAYFKGKNDTSTAKKKKNPKKQHFKEKKNTDVKSPTPKPQLQKPSAPTKQAGKGSAKQSGPVAKSINGSTTQAPKGNNKCIIAKLCVNSVSSWSD